MNKLQNQIRLSELSSLSAAILRAAESSEIKRKSVVDALAKLKELHEELVKANMREKTSVSLSKADKKRDEELRALEKILDGYVSMKNETTAENARKLKSVLDRYLKVKIKAQNFEAETGLIISLLDDFSSEELSQVSKSLPGVDEAISAVKSAHEEYIALHDSAVSSASNKPSSATSIKVPLLKVINETLVPVLNVAVLEEDAELSDFAKTVGEEIDRANALVSERAKKVNSASK